MNTFIRKLKCRRGAALPVTILVLVFVVIISGSIIGAVMSDTMFTHSDVQQSQSFYMARSAAELMAEQVEERLGNLHVALHEFNDYVEQNFLGNEDPPGSGEFVITGDFRLDQGYIDRLADVNTRRAELYTSLPETPGTMLTHTVSIAGESIPVTVRRYLAEPGGTEYFVVINAVHTSANEVEASAEITISMDIVQGDPASFFMLQMTDPDADISNVFDHAIASTGNHHSSILQEGILYGDIITAGNFHAKPDGQPGNQGSDIRIDGDIRAANVTFTERPGPSPWQVRGSIHAAGHVRVGRVVDGDIHAGAGAPFSSTNPSVEVSSMTNGRSIFVRSGAYIRIGGNLHGPFGPGTHSVGNITVESGDAFLDVNHAVVGWNTTTVARMHEVIFAQDASGNFIHRHLRGNVSLDSNENNPLSINFNTLGSSAYFLRSNDIRDLRHMNLQVQGSGTIYIYVEDSSTSGERLIHTNATNGGIFLLDSNPAAQTVQVVIIAPNVGGRVGFQTLYRSHEGSHRGAEIFLYAPNMVFEHLAGGLDNFAGSLFVNNQGESGNNTPMEDYLFTPLLADMDYDFGGLPDFNDGSGPGGPPGYTRTYLETLQSEDLGHGVPIWRRAVRP